LGEQPDAWMQALDQVEDEDAVNAAAGEREGSCQIPREHLDVAKVQGARRRRCDAQLADVVIDADDAARAASRLDGVGAVRAPNVEDEIRRQKILDVPIVPRRLAQVPGMDAVAAL